MKNKLLVVGLVMVCGLLVLGGGVASAAGFGPGGGRFGGLATPPAAVGKVASVSGDTITLTGMNGTTYTIDASGATVMKNGATSAVGDISTGDTLLVLGTANGTSITATTIHDGGMGGMKGGFGGRMMPGVFGTVASVNGTTLTVTAKGGPSGSAGTTYTVNAGSATVLKDGASSSIGNVAVGDNVMVQGTVSGTTVTATVIRDGIMGRGMFQQGPGPAIIQGNGEPVVGGSVTAITGTTLTVTNKSNVTYTIDAGSATIEKDGASSTIGSVAVGDNVLVQGTVNGNAVTASSVIDQGTGTSSANPGAAGATSSAPKNIFGAIGSFFHHIFGFF